MTTWDGGLNKLANEPKKIAEDFIAWQNEVRLKSVNITPEAFIADMQLRESLDARIEAIEYIEVTWPKDGRPEQIEVLLSILLGEYIE